MTSVMGKGAVPADHPLHLGSQALQSPVQTYIDSCDLLLVVGSRFTEIDTAGWTLRLPETLVQIDVDPAEIGRNYPAGLSVVGDAKLVLGQMLEVMGESSTAGPGRVQEVADVRAQVRRNLVGRSPEGVRLMDEIRSVLPSDGIIANDVCTPAYWGWMLLEVNGSGRYIYPWGFGTLGAGLPLGMGAKVARPDTAVLAICGDGGFLYTAMELATAVQFGINVVALVVNDNRFGILEPQQMDRFGRTTMTELKNPGFASLARSFGAYGVTIDSVEEVGPALRDAFAAERPAVVELQTVLPHPFEW
jgi:thiamine pyrophosphate-dependent acetolactate synthase large subunit-like protein